MRIEPIGSARVAYSINYIYQPKRLQKVKETREKEKEQKKQKQEMQMKMLKRMNVMAEQMQGMTGYYDKNGKGNSYEFSTYEVFQ